MRTFSGIRFPTRPSPRVGSRTRPRAVAVALAAGSLVGGTALAAVAAVPGGSDSGDPYFPGLGNTGYDARSYHLDLRYRPATRALRAVATIRLQPRVDLSTFNLDLRGLRVRSVRVDGRPAAFSQAGGELVVDPAKNLKKGRIAVARIRYGGTTRRPVDNTGSLFGWVSTPDGAVVASEAYGAPTWYPVNDSPRDKARYSFRVTVPRGKVAVANGLPAGRPVTRQGWTTYRWAERSPMASYLATVSIGDYAVTDRTVRGLRIIDAVDRDLPAARKAQARRALAKQRDIIAFFARRFGPYPFTSAGGIVDDDSLGYALETQTRPVYTGGASESTVAHEIAHQWYGDSVTPRRWADIWLNEGFATYAEWQWQAHTGGPSVAETAAEVLATPADSSLWELPPGDPGAENLYDPAVYQRGALALFELREEIGAQPFARVLRRWAAEHRHRNAGTADLVALAEQVSGQELDAFFQTWIYTPGKPAA